MTSEPIRMELEYRHGHRNRHTPRLCPGCTAPLTSAGRCTRCDTPAPPSRRPPAGRRPDRHHARR
jgi:hypothetical protein